MTNGRRASYSRLSMGQRDGDGSVPGARGLVLALAGGGLRYMGEGSEGILGYEPGDLFWRDAFELVHEGDLPVLVGAIEGAKGRPGSSFHVEVRMKDASGAFRPVEASVQNVLEAPVAGEPGLLVVGVRDVSERRAIEEELVERALRDPLTNLYNRASFIDRLGHALERARRRRESEPGGAAVLLLDLDDFKAVNDSLGHEVGDRLLVAVADRLRERLRASDTAARLGGDEFVVLLEDVRTVADAARAAGRIVEGFEEPFRVDGHELFAFPSVGVAVDGEDMRSSKDLLHAADTAMYRAKDKGKARYEIFESDMIQAARDRLRLEAELREAAANPAESFVLHYQPKVSLESGRIVGMEALIRWEHPERGIVSPDEFVALAEETGLIVPIGRWVLEEACRRARAWQDRYDEVSILWLSVNLSARQLGHKEITRHIEDALHKSGLRAANLSLEMTETALVEDVASAVSALRRLKELGVQVEIDDFGTGYSSLSYLKRFPADFLKLDNSFVDGLSGDEDDGGASSTITGAVISLAHALNLRVVGEGIETAAQLDGLKALGCDMGQGFYFSKPLTREAMEEMLARNPSW